jgi:GGDEF domain-containing protein
VSAASGGSTAGTGRAGAEGALRRLRSVSPIGWSVGVVEWQHGESLDRAMARADEDLYRAKREFREWREMQRGSVAATVGGHAVASSTL